MRRSSVQHRRKKKRTSHKSVSNDKSRRPTRGNRRSTPGARPGWRAARADTVARCARRTRGTAPRLCGTTRLAPRSGGAGRRARGGRRGSGFLPLASVLGPRHRLPMLMLMLMLMRGGSGGGREVGRERRMRGSALRWSRRSLESDRVVWCVRRRRRRRGASGASGRYRGSHGAWRGLFSQSFCWHHFCFFFGEVVRDIHTFFTGQAQHRGVFDFCEGDGGVVWGRFEVGMCPCEKFVDLLGVCKVCPAKMKSD